jgi:hypothetical protein
LPQKVSLHHFPGRNIIFNSAGHIAASWGPGGRFGSR